MNVPQPQTSGQRAILKVGGGALAGVAGTLVLLSKLPIDQIQAIVAMVGNIYGEIVTLVAAVGALWGTLKGLKAQRQ